MKDFTYEQCEKVFCSELVGGKWVNHDKHGFTRTLEFKILGRNFKVEWFRNQSTLIIDDAVHVMFHKAKISNTWPSPARCKNKIQFEDVSGEVVCVIPVEFYEDKTNEQ